MGFGVPTKRRRMPHLPAHFAGIIPAFAPLFVHRSWQHARVPLIGAIPAPGRRTVASVLRITGRSRERRLANCHRVLSRAARGPRTGGRILLGLLLDAFAPRGPVVMALDDTIEAIWREQRLVTPPPRGRRTKRRRGLPAPWAYALRYAA
jgi:hypothetical protein